MSSKRIIVDKLVRDKIPKIIKEDGGKPAFYSMYGYPFKSALFKKLNEEANELRIATADNTLEELADIYEVFLSIIKYYRFTIDDVVKAADNKRKEKGGFNSHIFLHSYFINEDSNPSDNGAKELNEIFNDEKELK